MSSWNRNGRTSPMSASARATSRRTFRLVRGAAPSDRRTDDGRIGGTGGGAGRRGQFRLRELKTDIFLPSGRSCSIFVLMTMSAISKLSSKPSSVAPLAGAGHRECKERRGLKRSSVKSGSWVSSIAALRCRRSRPARALRSSGCAMSFARSSLSACHSPQPNSSPFRSAVSTKRCSYLSARCTTPQGNELRGRRSRCGESFTSSTAITALPLFRGCVRELEAHQLPPPVEPQLALEGPSPSNSLIAPQTIGRGELGLANCERWRPLSPEGEG